MFTFSYSDVVEESRRIKGEALTLISKNGIKKIDSEDRTL